MWKRNNHSYGVVLIAVILSYLILQTHSQSTTSDTSTSATSSTSTAIETTQGTSDGELSAAMGILIGIAVLFLIVCADIVHKNFLKEANRLTPAAFDTERTLLEVNSSDMITVTTSADHTAGLQTNDDYKQEEIELAVAAREKQREKNNKLAVDEEEQKYDSNVFNNTMSQLSAQSANSDMLVQQMQNTEVPSSNLANDEQEAKEEEEDDDEENNSRETRETDSEITTSEELDDEQQDKIGVGLDSVKIAVNERMLQQPANNVGAYTPQSTRL